MGMPVGDLLDRMSGPELLAWATMPDLVPDPWYQTGLIASLLYNANRPKGDPALSPRDFVPTPDEQPPPEGQAAVSAFHQAATAMGLGVRVVGPSLDVG